MITYDLATFGDDVLAFPDHGEDGSGREVLHQSREEGTSLEVIIMLSSEGFSWDNNTNSNKLVSLTFETLDDLTDESTMNTVRLDGNEGTFMSGARNTSKRNLSSLNGLGVLVNSETSNTSSCKSEGSPVESRSRGSGRTRVEASTSNGGD